MPMPLPPSGGLPSPLTQAPANAGSMAMPQGNQGNIQAALIKIKNACKMLEEALPLVPMGDELHTDLLNTLKQLSKPLKKGGNENPQLEVGSLLQMAKNNAQSAPMAAMARMFSGGQGSGQPPATPQPTAA